jgi:hypothetical protein
MAEAIARVDVALLQLDRALDLYQAGGVQDLVCAITLAGAAEEILGRLVEGDGGTTAFGDTLELLCGMHKAAFPNDDPDPRAYATLRNKTRNDFKHITDNTPFAGDLEREASSMLRRAMTNHRKLGAGFVEKYRRFEVTTVARDRTRRGDA